MDKIESQDTGGIWSIERATKWWAEQPWRVGCNFIPSTAINQLEMWQAESFDEETLRRELGWAADLGFNVVRVYLHDLLWKQDSGGFLDRIDRFLGFTDASGIAVMFVLFDDVWSVNAQLGPQPAPFPGRHNSGWVQGPGLTALQTYPNDPRLRDRLESYVRGVVSNLARDPRVLIWDLYNEPGGFPSPTAEPVGELCLPLLGDVFKWVREISPDQPLTSGVWENPLNPLPAAIGELQLESSDIVSFHQYGPVDALRDMADRLRARTQRPLFCTEYLARPMGSQFESHLPVFRELGVGAINWGLVSGKTQTIYPWWSWFDDEPGPEPEVWFHDIFRQNGTPFDPAEVEFVQKIMGVTGDTN